MMAENSDANRIAAYKNQSDQINVEISNYCRDIVGLKPVFPLQENDGQSPLILPIDQIVNGLLSSDPKIQFAAAQSTRKILSPEYNPPIDLIINHGIVPIIVKFLDCYDSPDLQFEAIWTLTNIAAGTTEQTQTIVDAGGIPKLVSLLESPVWSLVDQAAWALSNIALDGPLLRDLVLDNDVVDRLKALLSKHIPLDVARNIVWLMSNLCCNKNPPPSFDKIKPMLPILAQYLTQADSKLLTDVCWTLFHISYVDNEKINSIIQAGILAPLINLLGSSEPKVIEPAVYTIGNIVNGTDSQTDAVLEAGALPYLKQLLKSPKQEIVYSATWTISNIAAGNRNQIQTLFIAEIYQEIINVLAHGDLRSMNEAEWVITNTITGGSFKQVVNLVKLLLDVKEEGTLIVVLNGLEKMLDLTEQHGQINNLCVLIEQAKGLDKLQQLQNHENDEICQMASEIIETYFNDYDFVDNYIGESDGVNESDTVECG